jgi:taurine dioxygenase
MRVEKLTCHIGAELSTSTSPRRPATTICSGDPPRAARAQGAVPARSGHQQGRPCRLRRALRRSRIIRSLGSDPEHPGLVCIYKDLDSPPDHYENAWHCDATWREAPPMGCVLRCIEGPAVGGDTIWANMAKAYADLPDR